MKVFQAYRFALDPSPDQERKLWSHAGGARFAWNWGLARCIERYEREGKFYNAIDLHRLWNLAKRTDPNLSWWSENSKWVYQEAFRDLHRSLIRFALSRKGLRRGARQGFPGFKKRAKAKVAFRLGASGNGKPRCTGRTVTLPRLGTVRTHEATRKLARRLENGTARILSVTVTRQGHRWFATFTCEVERQDRHPVQPNATVGVDLGIKYLAVLSTGAVVPNPRHSDRTARQIRRIARRMSRRVGPDKRTGQRPSNRWILARDQVKRAHARESNLRYDGLHKLTTRLTREYGTLVVEHLHVAGMVRNRKLSRHISDAAFGELRRQLGYKTVWNGGRLVVADRWYPSSKTCSDCGAVKAKLALSKRTYTCTTCGLVLDRDLNAARNLAALAANVAGSGPETLNGRGADQRTPLAGQVAVKRQPGTASAGQTGTVPPQGGTAASLRR